jgi:hypothetical protein
MASSFPQFLILPAELRLQIWKLALAPAPEISTITLSYTRWDALDTQAYGGLSYEVVQGNLWYFAFTPCRNLPAILFTTREAWSVGYHLYHFTRQIVHEIVNETVIGNLTTEDARIVVEDYSGSIPGTTRKERAIPCPNNHLFYVKTDPKVSIQPNLPLSYHAICDLRPLSFRGIKYLVMDAMEFHNRMYIMNSNPLVFSGLKVLFLVMEPCGNIAVGGREIQSDSAVDVWDFLKPGERADLEAGTAKWNVGEVVLVRSVEEALERVGQRET